MSIRTEFFSGLNRTPALRLALLGQLAMVETFAAEPLLNVAWDQLAIVGFVDEAPVGVITFQHTTWLKQLDICIGYVEPKFRCRGVYRDMFQQLVAKAHELGALAIVGNTATSNRVMRDTAGALGRDEVAVVLSYAVEPKA